MNLDLRTQQELQIDIISVYDEKKNYKYRL